MQPFILVYCSVHIAFCPTQHCSIARGSRDFDREDIAQGLRTNIRQKKAKQKRRVSLMMLATGSMWHPCAVLAAPRRYGLVQTLPVAGPAQELPTASLGTSQAATHSS